MSSKRTISRCRYRRGRMCVSFACMLYVCFVLYCSFFFFSSRRRHTRSKRDWSSDVCSSDLPRQAQDESKATYLRKREDREAWIDWTRPASEIQTLIRALTDRKSVV